MKRKNYNTEQFAKKLYSVLLDLLKIEYKRDLEDLQKGKAGFLVSWRTMMYLKAGDLQLKRNRIDEICERTGLVWTEQRTFRLKEKIQSEKQ